MKIETLKSSLIAITIVVLSLVLPRTMYATSTTTVEEQMFAKLLAAENLTSENLNAQDFVTANNGKNLYIYYINQTNFKLFESTLDSASSNISYPNPTTGSAVYFTKDEWRKMYLENNYGKILSSKLGISNDMTLLAIHDFLISKLKREMEDQALYDSLQDISQTTELFTDGNTENSGGFDLLSDYEFMELLLLGKVEKTQLDQVLTDSSLPPLQSIDLPAKEPTPQIIKKSQKPASKASTTTTPREEKVKRTTNSKPLALKAPANQGYADDSLEFAINKTTPLYNPDGVSPEACDVPQDLESSIKDYIEKSNDENLQKVIADTPIDTIPTIPSKPKNVVQPQKEDNNEQNTLPSDTDTEKVRPAKKAQWKIDTLCKEDSIFCLDVKFYKNGRECKWTSEANDPDSCFSVSFGNASSSGNVEGGYAETQNCVSCHLHYLVTNFDLLLSKTLTPSKAPGNLMESGKCKKSFLKVKPSINFFAIKKPIPLPPKTDPFFESTNPFQNFVQELTASWTGKSTALDQKDSQYLKHAATTYTNKDAISIAGDVDAASTAYSQELAQQEEILLLSNEMQVMTNSYQDVSQEMDRLRSVIESSDSIIQDLNEGSCEDLRSKKTCE